MLYIVSVCYEWDVTKVHMHVKADKLLLLAIQCMKEVV